MSASGSLWLVGGAAVLVVIGVVVWLFLQSRKFKLTETPEGEKPEWMRNLPPTETLEALKADGEKIAVFDHDPGEELAAPFAEQIEDIVRSRLENDPELKAVKIDFGTGPDGGLMISLDGKQYPSVELIADERMKTLIKTAIATYQKYK
jgi:hypothetical protein